jgi:2'-5' RNA ligase
MKRIFIGIPVESERAAVQAEKWKYEPDLNGYILKWTKPANWHITLIFLGNTPEAQIGLLQNLIGESFAEVPAFKTEITGIGVFPNTRNPKVLWLGVENLQPLMPGYLSLTEMLQQLDFSLENKPFKPHLTLARMRNSAQGSPITSMIEKHQNSCFGSVEIKSVVLYESISTTDGPVYNPLFVKNLKEK